MNIFNLDGDRPELNTVESRRMLDLDKLLKNDNPEVFVWKEKLLEDKYQIVDDFFKSSRGFSLATRTIIPPNKPKAAIVFCHGYSDSLRWNNLRIMFKLAEQGYLVTGIEHEGHGLSENKLGLIMDINHVVQDFHEFIKRQQKNYAIESNKWFVFGESMGGMISILQSLKQEQDVKVDGMILIVPMCKIEESVKPPWYLERILMLMSKIAPSLSVVPSDICDEVIFKEKWMCDLQKKNPIKFNGKPRLGTSATLYNSTLYLEKHMEKIKRPFLVIHGDADLVTSFEASKELFERSTAEDKEIFVAKGAWHGLLYCEPEDEMKKYWNKIFQWIQHRS